MGQLASIDIEQVECIIAVIGPREGEPCFTELIHLPKQAKIVATGRNLEELLINPIQRLNEVTVLLNLTGTKETLPEILYEMPLLQWIHSIGSGLDKMLYYDLIHNPDIIITNAKGVYSKSLAEYVMASISYFSKQFNKLINQKDHKIWDRFPMNDINGKTIGIIGYGDIGKACAQLAKAYDMNVIALKRHVDNESDSIADRIYGPENLLEIARQADYVVVSCPLTTETKNLINKKFFKESKSNQIIINISRGDVINEEALINALNKNLIAGAALDVFSTEPLPASSSLWDLSNVLISPHNADYTIDSRHKSVRLFCENCRRVLNNENLLNIVNKELGY